jgi:hypothetical protein
LKKFTTYDDDGRQVMAIAHLTFWVRWAKNVINLFLCRAPTNMATVTKNRTYGKIAGNNSKTVNNIKNLTCVAYQDLPTLQFWSKFDYPSWSYCPFFINFFYSGHVGWCTASPDTILKLETLVMIQTKFGFHWSSTFRGEDFWKSLRRATTTSDGNSSHDPLGDWMSQRKKTSARGLVFTRKRPFTEEFNFLYFPFLKRFNHWVFSNTDSNRFKYIFVSFIFIFSYF